MLEKSRVTIGLPVFNGERTIKKTLDSITSQTFADFQVIISDNNSTDNTPTICKEYSEKNSEIKYFRQNENIGVLNNFKFVLNHANSEYFVWLSSDDWWEPTFLEKNISVLDLDENFIASISKIDYFDTSRKNIKKDARILTKKIKKYYSYDEYSNFRKYQDRVSFYLRLNRAENMYGLFRTEILKKCVQKCFKKESMGMDLKILLYIQRFGEINIVNEILLHRSAKGMSYSEKKNLTKFNDIKIVGKLFPLLSFSLWILRNLGLGLFFKNIDYILFINGSATKYQLKHGLK